MTFTVGDKLKIHHTFATKKLVDDPLGHLIMLNQLITTGKITGVLFDSENMAALIQIMEAYGKRNK